MTIKNLLQEYRNKLDLIDIELIIANSLAKTREFVLTHPEHEITTAQGEKIKDWLTQRMSGKPLSQITGHKEFFGLDFKVNESTLIPRPETEMLVESVISNQQTVTSKNGNKTFIIDVGTGSGNIIISIAKKITDYRLRITNYDFIGIDISKDALKIAKHNARTHGVDNPPAGGINFLHGNLLTPLLDKMKAKKLTPEKLIIVANLPYLSEEVFEGSPIDVKNFEPKSALYSDNAGLAHYEKLLNQINTIPKSYELKTISCILEFSPEQKPLLESLIKKILPQAQTVFRKDLAGKWRMAKLSIE